MAPIETLKQLVPSIDTGTLPSAGDWEEVEGSVGARVPRSLKEFVDTFGHGTWGRDLVFFHPNGARFQRLQASNLIEIKSFVDPDFRSFMPNDVPAAWSIIPVARLPYRLHVFQHLESEEIILYDGDYCEELNTGMIGPASFILESLRWREISLPRIWSELTEVNWPFNMPVFDPNCRREPEGLFALGPNFH